MSNDITTAIKDPYGYGFEGRVAVDRHASKRRKNVATVISQFSTHSLLAPVAVQYEYFLCYGYYTAEEMKDHPGRRKLVLSKAELQKMEIEQEVRDTKQQKYLTELHEIQWEKHERRVKRWGQRRAELEQQRSQNSQQEDLVSQHDDIASEHDDAASQQDDAASQHDDAAGQQDDVASQQDEPMNDNEYEPLVRDILSDGVQVSGWNTTEAMEIPSNIHGAFGRRHSTERRRAVYGGRRGRGGDRIHVERPGTEGSSSTGDVYMSGALRGGYGGGRGNVQYGSGSGRGRADAGADSRW